MSKEIKLPPHAISTDHPESPARQWSPAELSWIAARDRAFLAYATQAVEAALREAPQAEPSPPHEWDEYALKEVHRLWALPEMPKVQLVACLQVALVDAMHFAGRADNAVMRQALAALEWVVEQGGGPLCEHEGAVCFCKENRAINALRTRLLTPSAPTAVEPDERAANNEQQL